MINLKSFAFEFLIALIAIALNAQGAIAKATLTEQAAQFENRLCGVNPNRTLFRNQKREEVVLQYRNHAPRGRTRLAEFPATFKKKSERRAEVKKFVDSNYAMVRDFDDVAATIGDRYIAKKLNWLGIEAAADELAPEHEVDLFKSAAAVEAQLKKDKIKDAEIKNFILLHLGPIYYSRWRNVQLRKITRVVPLDDVTIRHKSRAYIDGKEAKATALLQAVPGSGIRTSDMEKIIDISQVSLFSGVKERTPELLSLMEKIKKPAVKSLVQDYRVWIEQGVDTLVERDTAVAKTILAQSGMGLILLSTGFGPGVSEQLMNACPNHMKKPAK